MVLFGVDVLVMLISCVLTLMFAWPTYMPVPKAMKTSVKTFWTVNSRGLELGAQLEFQTFFMAASAVPILFAIAMLAQETIEYAAVLRPGKNIFKYLFLGLDIILGELLASAGLIPLPKIRHLHVLCILLDLIGTITN